MILAVSAIAWEAVGFFGQGLFTARFLVQWLASEKKKESVVPVSFWWLSVTGSAVLVLYAAVLKDPVFLLGSLVNGFLYARNLLLIYVRGNRPTSKRVLVPTAAAMVAFLLFVNVRGMDRTIPIGWLLLGFVGAALWTGRFVIQWFASERAGKSVMPRSFWYVGLIGSALLLAYSVYRQKPVFILGYLFPPVPYVRNLILIYRKEGAPHLVRWAAEMWADTAGRRLAIAFFALFLAAFLAVRVVHSNDAPNEFLRAHHAGRLVMHGLGPELYTGDRPFGDPPPAAVLLTGLGALPLRIAEIVWTWAAAFAFLGLLAVCRAFTRRYGASAAVTWITGLLVLRFGWDSLNLGSAHALVVLAATAGIWLAETDRPARGGLLTALAAVTKVWPLVLVAVYLVRGRWRALGWSLAGLVLLAGVLPAAVFGPSRAIELYRTHATEQAGAIANAAPANVPGVSLRAMSFRLLDSAPFEKLGGTTRFGLGWLDAGAARTVYLVAAGLLLAALLLLAARARSDFAAPLVAGAAIAVAVVTSPVASEAEFLAIALLVSALAAAAFRPGARRSPAVIAAITLAFALAALPARSIVGRTASDTLEALCAAGFATLLLLAVVPAALSRSSGGPRRGACGSRGGRRSR